MSGRDVADASDLTAIPGLLMFAKDRKWRPAIEPITKDRAFVGTFAADGKKITSVDPWDIVLPTDSSTQVRGVGPGRTFGRLLREAMPDCEVGLIPTSVGGTGISSWLPGGVDRFDAACHPYDESIALALDAQAYGEIIAILWHQGETDAATNNTEYKQQLSTVIANFRKDLHLSDQVPFIMGELGSFYEAKIQDHVDMIDQAMHELAAELPSVAVVPAKDLVSRGDNLHFSRESAHRLGERYFSAYQQFTASSK